MLHASVDFCTCRLGCCEIAAKTRSIAVPADLDAQLTALFSKAQILQKHTRVWITAGKTRADTALQLTHDYRNIVEGFQASKDHCYVYPYTGKMSCLPNITLF